MPNALYQIFLHGVNCEVQGMFQQPLEPLHMRTCGSQPLSTGGLANRLCLMPVEINFFPQAGNLKPSYRNIFIETTKSAFKIGKKINLREVTSRAFFLRKIARYTAGAIQT
jgi:hypothetical protein